MADLWRGLKCFLQCPEVAVPPPDRGVTQPWRSTGLSRGWTLRRTGRLEQAVMLASVVGMMAPFNDRLGHGLGRPLVQKQSSLQLSVPPQGWPQMQKATWPQVTSLSGQPRLSAWSVRQDKVPTSWPETGMIVNPSSSLWRLANAVWGLYHHFPSLTYLFPLLPFPKFKSPGNSLIHILHTTGCFRFCFPRKPTCDRATLQKWQEYLWWPSLLL